ncbi:MAG: LPS export ABC transporter periplasmic protein LptC [Endomicrobia bacterium]|nr:LPS export ABC transporter periplasmic protein LptC [Endomicrobiia bacterium]MCL2507251.1 LPS export ABC transporter periplasmic protein LptC [Endomicrobiia bacterium]
MKNRITLIGLFIVCVVFFAGCKAEQTVIEEMPPMSEQAVEKFTITETESGKLKMILESESAIINEDKKIAYLKLPRVKFYQDGQYSSTLVSESATINLETYDISGHGKCTVDTVDNEHLQTTNLQYNAKEEKVYSKHDVVIKRQNETVYGKSFEADTKLEKIVIKQQKVILSNTGV